MSSRALALINVTCSLQRIPQRFFNRAETRYFPKLGRFHREHFVFSSLCCVLAVLYVIACTTFYSRLCLLLFESSERMRCARSAVYGETEPDSALIDLIVAMAISQLLSK